MATIQGGVHSTIRLLLMDNWHKQTIIGLVVGAELRVRDLADTSTDIMQSNTCDSISAPVDSLLRTVLGSASMFVCGLCPCSMASPTCRKRSIATALLGYVLRVLRDDDRSVCDGSISKCWMDWEEPSYCTHPGNKIMFMQRQ